MCGRINYVQTSAKILEDHYGAKLVEGFTEQGFGPWYNIPPSAETPVVTLESPEEISVGHWGYKPAWAEGKKLREVINARAESLFDKPFFKSSAEHRRCLIPVTGYFEWQRKGKTKIPYHFHMGGEIFSLAGVYATLKTKKGEEMPHYAIITTAANALMRPVHDRMPVIIPAASEQEWISDALSDRAVEELCRPSEIDTLRKDQISSLVNSPKNNSPKILEPVG